MNATTTGLLAGLILGVAGSIGGFGPFLITLRRGHRRAAGRHGDRRTAGRHVNARARAGPMRTPLAEPAERGRLDIHPAVLRKIVEHAADGVPGTLRNERRLAGIDVGESGASARVTVGPGDPAPVDVRLELTLRYPARGAQRGRRRARRRRRRPVPAGGPPDARAGRDRHRPARRERPRHRARVL